MPRTAAERYADCRRLVDLALDGDAAKLNIEVRKFLGVEPGERADRLTTAVA